METKNTNVIDNNLVNLSGVISSEAEFSHEIFGEKFYTYNLSVKRLSGDSDDIKLTISERLASTDSIPVGTKVAINGQFRSYNKHEDRKNHLILSVFVREIFFAEEEDDDDNEIALCGYVCKQPVYRKTPLGREICDLLLAVNRPYGKSDYIPCISWGRNARYTANFEVGQAVSVHGRIQSRTYMKKINSDESNNEEAVSVEQKTAYEVSISKIEIVE